MAIPASLRQRFERLEADRLALLDSLSGLDDETLRHKPSTERWSIVQLLGHVTMAEEATLGYIRKKMQDPSAIPPAGLGSLAKLLVLAASLRSPLRFRAPERTASPPSDRSLSEARAHWAKVRADWLQLLETFPAALLGRAVFRHPFAGRLSLAHTLAFMDEHLRHHAKQIDRLRPRP